MKSKKNLPLFITDKLDSVDKAIAGDPSTSSLPSLATVEASPCECSQGTGIPR